MLSSPIHFSTSDARARIAGVEGHLHIEPSPRQYRIFTDNESQNRNEAFMQSLHTFLVWESLNLHPRLAFSTEDIAWASDKGVGLIVSKDRPEPSSSLVATYYDLFLGESSTTVKHVAYTYNGETPLTPSSTKDAPAPNRLVVILPSKFFSVWEEDSPIIGGIKNPYHRVDMVPTRRHIQVFAIPKSGKTERVCLADTASLDPEERPVALFETGYPIRWYLPFSALQVAQKAGVTISPATSVQKQSYPNNGFRTVCPYKGYAYYHSITLPNGETLENVAWAYPEPIQAFDARGLVCFWTPGKENLVLVVDGQEVGS